MSGLQISVLTPHRRLVENEAADEIIAPGVRGQLDILPGHANFVTELVTGVVTWKKEGVTKTAAISYGVLEIFDGHATIMADVSELSDDIDLGRAKASEEKSRKLIEEGGLDDENFRKYQLKLQRATARISAVSE